MLICVKSIKHVYCEILCLPTVVMVLAKTVTVLAKTFRALVGGNILCAVQLNHWLLLMTFSQVSAGLGEAMVGISNLRADAVNFRDREGGGGGGTLHSALTACVFIKIDSAAEMK